MWIAIGISIGSAIVGGFCFALSKWNEISKPWDTITGKWNDC
jgi:hypothetical protein